MKCTRAPIFTHNDLRQLEIIIGDSFHVFSPQTFTRNLRSLKRHIGDASPQSIVAYAMKANYMPEILRLVAREGAWLEAASDLEAKLALQHVPCTRIIFNGPQKCPDLSMEIADRGGLVILHSRRELTELLHRIPDGKLLNIGVRYNSSNNGPGSRFGFNLENGDFQKCIEQIHLSRKLRIVALHCHYSTSQRSPTEFSRRLQTSIDIIERFNLDDIGYIDIGGGLQGPVDTHLEQYFASPIPTFADYSSELARALKSRPDFLESGKTTLVVEPGVSLVADSFVFVCKALETTSDGKTINVQINSSLININPTHSSTVLPPFVVSKRRPPSPPTTRVTIQGNTCMETDIIEDLPVNQAPYEGDYLVFQNRGAYSINRASSFIHARPGVVDTNGRILKKRESIDCILAEYDEQSNIRLPHDWD